MSALPVTSSEHVWSHGTLRIKVEREATLTPDLSAIESRRSRGVYLEVGAGWTRLTVEQAEHLRGGLAAAIELANSVPDIEPS